MRAFSVNFVQNLQSEEEILKIYLNILKQILVKIFKNGKLFLTDKTMKLQEQNLSFMQAR